MIYLPESIHVPKSPEAAPRAVRRGTEQVLVIDDEADICRLVCSVLQKHGYTVMEASTAEQAITLAGRAGHNLDLIITDVVMPGKNGPQLVEHLRQNGCLAKVLFMSGYTFDSPIPESLRNSALLPKPFTAQDLLRQVRSVLDPDE